MGKHYGMKMKRMERLLEVAKKIDPKQFDMSAWFKADFSDEATKGEMRRYDQDTEQTLAKGALPNGHLCNTTACLAGWACVDPVLHRQGLTLIMSKGESEENRKEREVWAELSVCGKSQVTDYWHNSELNDSPLAEFFGLAGSGVEAIFFETSAHGAKGKRHMIAEIKRVMAQPELYGSES